jgi:DNA-binding NtrC family response regulator
MISGHLKTGDTETQQKFMEYIKPRKIFIVNADLGFSQSLKGYLTRTVKHEVQYFENCEDCLKNITDAPEIVIISHFQKSSENDASKGIEILEIIKKNYPEAHIIVIADHEGYGTAMQTILKGAEQYVIKDKDTFEKITVMLNELN